MKNSKVYWLISVCSCFVVIFSTVSNSLWGSMFRGGVSVPVVWP